jgi:phage terminase small subunit
LKKFAFHSFDHLHDSWIERKEFEDLSPEIKSCIQEIDTKVLKKNIGSNEKPEIVDVEHIRIKLVDKRLALQDLSKMMGWNAPSKVEVDQTVVDKTPPPQIVFVKKT